MNFLGYVIGMLLILAQGPEQEEDGYLEFVRDPEEERRAVGDAGPYGGEACA